MIQKVAIIGTGVAGLGLAACLKQIPTGVSEVVVYDSRSDTIEYNEGGAIGLSGGVAIINLLGGLHELQQNATLIQKYIFSYQDEELINLDVTEIKDLFPAYMRDPDSGNPLLYAMRWSALRLVLRNCAHRRRRSIVQDEAQVIKTKAAEEDRKDEESKEGTEESVAPRGSNNSEEDTRLQESRIIFKSHKRLSSIEEDEQNGKVHLTFDDGTVEEDFDLVVGADGVRSKVREFTHKPNATVLSWFSGIQNTGIRVTQCLTPVDESNPKNKQVEKFLSKMRRRGDGEIHFWCGDGSNALTVKIGGFTTTHYALASIYRETNNTLHGQNSGWVDSSQYKDEIKQRLIDSGFDNFHDLHSLFDAASLTGGRIFEVGVRDTIFPFKTWSSKSGRVILIGDSAHAMSPFLGQGGNQALQDAFSLTSLIFYFNQGARLPIVEKLTSANFDLIENFFLATLLRLFYFVGHAIFNYFAIVRVLRPTKLQRLVYEFEERRKFHAFLITLGARIFGWVETLGGTGGVLFKRLFFKLLGTFQLAKIFLLSPMKPVV